MEGENDLNTKKLIALLLCAAMAASILCACQLSDTDTPSGTAEPTDPAAARGGC